MTGYWTVLKAAAPEGILALVAFCVLALDLVVLRGQRMVVRYWAGVGVCLAGIILAVLWLLFWGVNGSFLSGMLAMGSLAATVKVVLLVLLAFGLCAFGEPLFTRHTGEFLALVIFAAIGMLFLASAENLLMIFLALELTSLSLYLLAGFDKSSGRSSEAALKYFLFGGVAAGITLYGLSLLYGGTGGLSFVDVAAALERGETRTWMSLALVLTVVGFGFKVAAVPFAFWAPDTYHGAPTPSGALIASISKVASFFVLAKVLMIALGPMEGRAAWTNFAQGWAPVVAVMALLSVFVGNLAALVQSRTKRLLAYSAMAHAGYTLIGLLASTPSGMAAVIYYSATYALSVIGIFSIIAIVEENVGNDRIESFAGLAQSSPILAFCLMIFLLSLAGIPPLAGFFGKFYLFSAAMTVEPRLGVTWIVAAAILLSAVSLYYYLIVLKEAYVRPLPLNANPVRCPPSIILVCCVMAGAITFLGCFPEWFIGRITTAAAWSQ